jgi:hypothetical protein
MEINNPLRPFCSSQRTKSTHSVSEGCYPFNKAYGISPWEYVGKNPQTNRTFNEAMAPNSSIVMASVAKIYEDGLKKMLAKILKLWYKSLGICWQKSSNYFIFFKIYS